MINVSTDTICNISVMDPIIREVIGGVMFGMSAGPHGTIVHLADTATPQQISIAENALAGYWVLNVETDKQQIAADDVDAATIRCADPQIGTLSTVNYHVLFDGIEYASGTAELVNGVVSLELTSGVPGRFIVVIWSDVNYKSGAVVVEVI